MGACSSSSSGGGGTGATGGPVPSTAPAVVRPQAATASPPLSVARDDPGERRRLPETQPVRPQRNELWFLSEQNEVSYHRGFHFYPGRCLDFHERFARLASGGVAWTRHHPRTHPDERYLANSVSRPVGDALVVGCGLVAWSGLAMSHCTDEEERRNYLSLCVVCRELGGADAKAADKLVSPFALRWELPRNDDDPHGGHRWSRFPRDSPSASPFGACRLLRELCGVPPTDGHISCVYCGEALRSLESASDHVKMCNDDSPAGFRPLVDDAGAITRDLFVAATPTARTTSGTSVVVERSPAAETRDLQSLLFSPLS